MSVRQWTGAGRVELMGSRGRVRCDLRTAPTPSPSAITTGGPPARPGMGIHHSTRPYAMRRSVRFLYAKRDRCVPRGGHLYTATGWQRRTALIFVTERRGNVVSLWLVHYVLFITRCQKHTQGPTYSTHVARREHDCHGRGSWFGHANSGYSE